MLPRKLYICDYISLVAQTMLLVVDPARSGELIEMLECV